MRTKFRKKFFRKRNLNRVLFIAPVAGAFVVLLLYTQNKAAFAAAWRNPLAMLSDRSPGSRDAGALYNTKPQRTKHAQRVRGPGGLVPQERVLAAMRERALPLADLLPPDYPLLDLGDTFAPLSDDLGLPALAPGTRTPSFAGVPGGPGFPGVLPLNEIGTSPDDNPETPVTTSPVTEIPDEVPSGTPGTPVTPDVPGETVESPVPEPSTWAMMIVGFGAIGLAMRRTRSGVRRLGSIRGKA